MIGNIGLLFDINRPLNVKWLLNSVYTSQEYNDTEI